MAKGKNLNPADAFRKAQRKKELKKNKTERSKTRDHALVKKDTTDLEEEVERLEFAVEAKDKARYLEAKAELDKIYQKKEAYLKEHPEQRRLVYRKKGDEKANEEIVLLKRNYFDKNGLPRHPERSIYYDKVMNPFGVAPPGMPYQERPRLPGEVYSDDSEDDDDIAMPEGPPPGQEEEDSDDDIPMPEGPPPGTLPPLPASVPLPPMPPPPPGSLHVPFPPPPPGPPPNSFPPGFPGAGYPGFLPPPPMPAHGLPPPPPGFFPPRNPSSYQDPLSSVPHQTFQVQHMAYALPPKPVYGIPASASLPAKPVAATSAANLMSATVFAAPELRDFKKEATAFVPSNVKRKKAATASGSAPRVNAAPSTSEETVEESGPVRPDLLGTLKGKFGLPPPAPVPAANAKEAQTGKPRDDYDKFVESMADILGPAPSK
ncbi:mRNA biogenesis factor-domain-containing protein [Roridomyces roridus]|uniref:mRNA biogenesis factor-domain-containing protein n=1 Tax=Roridomyces roridus TaxID=1738132 RepID=A0AAD7B0P7_9AGAR|nr:mRNA biogenesis factor-domain-containing protein [Roridomyces roridus]KAJ7640968.1 mRNA biogenesis factor-domain-containing protein [Roridomyces roridus]